MPVIVTLSSDPTFTGIGPPTTLNWPSVRLPVQVWVPPPVGGGGGGGGGGEPPGAPYSAVAPSASRVVNARLLELPLHCG